MNFLWEDFCVLNLLMSEVTGTFYQGPRKVTEAQII